MCSCMLGVFSTIRGHLLSDNHVKTDIFPHNITLLRKYNILFHIYFAETKPISLLQHVL